MTPIFYSSNRINMNTSLEDLISFEFDPNEVKLIWTWNCAMECAKIISLNSLYFGLGGAALGLLGSFFTRDEKCIYGGTITGLCIGGGIGLGFGTVKVVIYVKDLKSLENTTKESAQKSQRIFQALFETFCEGNKEGKEIFCPITQNVFTLPLKTPCGHVFEFAGINEYLNEFSSCPTCRKKVGIRDLEYDEETDEFIAIAVQKTLNCLSRIVSLRTSFKGENFTLAKRVKLQPKDAFSSSTAKNLAFQIAQNDSFLDNEMEIISKIKSGTLNELEAYVLIYFVSKKLEKFNQKINKLYDAACKELEKLRNEGTVSNNTHSKEILKIGNWYRKFQTNLNEERI